MYIKWFLLTIITCGIFGYFAHVEKEKWEMTHTCYDDIPHQDGQKFTDSFYDGPAGEYLGQGLVASLLIVLSCGISQPWQRVRLIKFDLEHSVVNGDRMIFEGTGAQNWDENSINSILTVVTCGIYASWGIARMNRWVYRHTFVGSTGNVDFKNY